MWKTFYSLFRDLPNEQEMYKAIASVGTLLLNLGELTSDNPRHEPDLTESTERSPKLSDCSPMSSYSSEIPEKLEGINSGGAPGQGCDSTSNVSDTSCPQARLYEALADAAASIGSSSTSRDGSPTEDDYVRVGSEEGLSSPELIELDEESAAAGHTAGTSGEFTETSEDLTEAYGKFTNAFEKLRETPETFPESSGRPNGSGDNEDLENLKTARKAECEIPLKSNEETAGSIDDTAQSGRLEPRLTQKRRSSGAVDSSWLITFEQFLASVLTEPLLVQYFEEETDIEDVINTVKTEGVRNFVRDPRRSLIVE